MDIIGLAFSSSFFVFSLPSLMGLSRPRSVQITPARTGSCSHLAEGMLRSSLQGFHLAAGEEITSTRDFLRRRKCKKEERSRSSPSYVPRRSIFETPGSRFWPGLLFSRWETWAWSSQKALGISVQKIKSRQSVWILCRVSEIIITMADKESGSEQDDVSFLRTVTRLDSIGGPAVPTLREGTSRLPPPPFHGLMLKIKKRRAIVLIILPPFLYIPRLYTTDIFAYYCY